MSQPYNKELSFLKSLAHQAGEIMRRNYRGKYGIYTKPDRSKVTDVDLEISAVVQREVRQHFPETGLYSEESDDKKIEPGKSYFIIDELDGTSYFIDGIPGFSHQAAFYDAESGRLEVGLVYYPLDDIMVFAVRGQGAFIEESGKTRSLPRISVPLDIGQLRFAHPMRYQGDRYWNIFEDMGVDEGRVVMVTASRTLKFALGELDAMIFLKRRIPPWDLSGEKVIVEELGMYHGYLGGVEVRFGVEPPENNPGYLICPKPMQEMIQGKALEVLV